MASLACLASALALAGLLAHDGVQQAPLEGVHEGEAVRIQGELSPLDPEASWYDHVAYALSQTSYIVEIDGVDDLVVLTGMEPGWDETIVVAQAQVLLQTPHPDEPIDIIVLFVEDVQEPAVFR